MQIRTNVTVTQELLAEAAASVGVDAGAVPALWSRLEAIAPRPAFNLPNVVFYFGATIVIAAMTWFMTSAWDETGGSFKLVAALLYAAFFAACGYALRRRGLRVPSGLLFTAAVCMTPLAVYGAEAASHFWLDGDPGTLTNVYPRVRGSYIFMELATIVVGLVTIRIVRFPFMVAPIGFASWFASMNLAALVFGKTSESVWDPRVSIAVGLVTIAAAFVVDRVTREDYAFWLYLFGGLSFWGGILSRAEFANEITQFEMFVVGLLFFAASLVLGRRVLAVFGGFECLFYVGHLAWDFRDSFAFPIVLTFVGLAVIGIGVLVQANLAKLEAKVDEMIPASLRALIPQSRVQ